MKWFEPRVILPLLLGAVLVSMVAAPGRWCGAGNAPPAMPSVATQPAVAPFEARALDGRPVRFPADYRGKIVLLDFWATWCAPCRAEIPHLVAAARQFGPAGLEIIGASLDQPSRVPAATVRRFAEAQQMAWPQIYEDGPRLAERFGVTSIPAGFLLDGDTGRLLATGDALRGRALARTIQHQLEARQPRAGSDAGR